MADHVNKNFLDRITGKNLPIDENSEEYKLKKAKLQEEENKKKHFPDRLKKLLYMEQFYRNKNKPKNFTLNEIQKNNLTETLEKHFSRLPKHLKEQVGKEQSPWILHNTPVGIFYTNKDTGQWMNNLGVIANSLDELMHASGEDLDGGLDARSAAIIQSIEDPILPAATSILDYDVWATTFYEVPSWNTPSYTTYGIVPIIEFVDGGGYNGRRAPGATGISNWSSGSRSSFVSLAQTIPVSRRVCKVWAYMDEFPTFSWNKADYYRNTADGITYQNTRFLTPFPDVMYDHNKTHLRAFLQYLDSQNITIPYFQDDKEAIPNFLGLYGIAGGYGVTQFDVNGNPLEYKTSSEGGSYYYDARYTAAYMRDPKYAGFTNPQTNRTMAQTVVDVYKGITPGNAGYTGTAFDLLARSYGVTHPGDFVGYALSFDRQYSYFGPGNPISASKYLDDTYIVAAHNAAIREMIQGYYAARVFNEVFQEIPRFNSSIYSDYEEFPISIENGRYYQDSNNVPMVQTNYSNLSGGTPYYGNHGNITRIGGWVFPYTAASYTSGYVRNPQTDDERYNLQGHNLVSYTPSPGASLIRVGASTVNTTEARREVAHKQFVIDLKHLRLQYISKSDWYLYNAPWIWFNAYYSSSFDEHRYGIELMYHILLHGVLYINHFESFDSPYERNILNNILNVWRDRSYNSHSRPCSNATGNVNLPVDKLVLADAFDNVAISGGRMVKTGKYLWRITAPPTAIRANGTIVFQRVGSDSDIPATVVCDPSSIYNGRGIWIKRLVSTPPQYVTVP